MPQFKKAEFSVSVAHWIAHETDARAKLKNYMDKFTGVSSKGVKKTARETITMLFGKADNQLKVLDKLMIPFKEKNRQLYSRYEAARVILMTRDASLQRERRDENPPPQPE